MPGVPSEPGPPPGSPANLQALVQIAAQLNVFQGSLPHPSILEAYERIVPGSAERLLSQAESQTAHRQDLEKRAIGDEGRRAHGGLVAGTIIVLGMEAVAGGAIIAGQSAAGVLLAGGSLAALAGVFVYGTLSRRHEREEKARIMMTPPTLPNDFTNPTKPN